MQMVPYRVPDAPRRNPAIGQIEATHDVEQAPAQRIVAQDGDKMRCRIACFSCNRDVCHLSWGASYRPRKGRRATSFSMMLRIAMSVLNEWIPLSSPSARRVKVSYSSIVAT